MNLNFEVEGPEALQLKRTSYRCCNSSSSSLELEHTALALCVRVLHCIYKPGCDGCHIEDINQCEWAFYNHWLLRFHLLEVLPKCPGRAWNHLVWLLLW